MKRLQNKGGIVAAFLALLLSCGEGTTDETFLIEGYARGMVDGEALYLLDNATNTVIDSAFVIGERFTMRGSVTPPAAWILIRTWNYSDFKFFWLENKRLTFEGEKGSFRFAKVTGSATQTLFDSLEAVQSPYQRQYDSLFRINDRGLTRAERAANRLKMDWCQMKIKVCEMDYVRQNPDNISSAFLLNLYKVAWGRQVTEEFYRRFPDQVRNTRYGERIHEFLSLNRDPKVGDSVIGFSQENPQGRLVSVSDFKGKVLLIEFWSSRCGPCRVKNPKLVEIYREFRARGFEVLGVGLEDSRDAWVKAIETDGILWESVSDLKGDENAAAMMYGVSAIPDNVLVDKNGVIVERGITIDELKIKLDQLVGSNL